MADPVDAYESTHPLFSGKEQDARARRVVSLMLSLREKAAATMLKGLDDDAPATEMTTGQKLASIVVQGEMGILRAVAKNVSAPPSAPVVMINNVLPAAAWEAEAKKHLLAARPEPIDVQAEDVEHAEVEK